MVRYLLFAAMIAAASGSASSQVAPALSGAPPVFASSGDASFDSWRAEFARRALAQGRPASAVAQVLTGLTPDPRVVRLDQNQPEFVRPVWDYIDRAVTADRIVLGRRLRAENASTFSAVERAFGVDPDVIAGIWAVETNFGRAPLPHYAPQAIATLAAEGRRRERFEAYLLAVIDMVDRGYAGPAELKSSWAGALGQPQFMPDVYLTDAVDFNNDGRRDIWRDQADVFASVANYLVRRGWKPGQPVFDEVRLSPTFDYSTADGRRLPVAAWVATGVFPMTSPSFSASTLPLQAELFLPAGADGPALLLYDNFRAIRAYNPSDRYSLAVALLADGFKSGGGLRTAWPRSQGSLQKPDMLRLQQLLAARGLDPGVQDGVIGLRTRSAVRAYQSEAGLRPDGWPTPALLARMEHSVATPLDATGINRLQAAFVKLGQPIGAPTGTVGPRTRAAILTLEGDLGLPQTGEATSFILATAEARAAKVRARPQAGSSARRRR